MTTLTKLLPYILIISQFLFAGVEAKGTSINLIESIHPTKQERIILESFIQHALEYAEKLDQAKVKQQLSESPEMFAWVEFKYLNCLNIAYELTGDSSYLEIFAEKFSLFYAVMRTQHDRYLGWYGLPLKNRRLKDKPDLQIDEIQMNFRAISILSYWIELVRKDASLTAKYEDTIQDYLILMEQHLYPKWDDRGHFTNVAGKGGVYHGLDYPIKDQFTLSFEKLSIMLDGIIKLYRVSGKDQYMKRALAIGTWFKSNLILKDGHYEWMSWVPSGEWDKHPDGTDKWKVPWIAPDPNAEWYITSLSIALNLYQHGLLFNETDIDRFVKTQKEMCWNGNMDKPEYRNVSGETNKWLKGRFLSDQLAHYDPILQKLAFHGPHEAERLKQATSTWKGGANAQNYIYEKFIMQKVIKTSQRPFERYGMNFLANPKNKSYYKKIYFEVSETGAMIPPAQPSKWLGIHAITE